MSNVESTTNNEDPKAVRDARDAIKPYLIGDQKALEAADRAIRLAFEAGRESVFQTIENGEAPGFMAQFTQRDYEDGHKAGIDEANERWQMRMEAVAKAFDELAGMPEVAKTIRAALPEGEDV